MKWLSGLSFSSPRAVVGTVSTSVAKIEEATETAKRILEERNKKYSERVAKKKPKDAE